jgi:phosphotransferase system HPr-like phosphotransfer protein
MIKVTTFEDSNSSLNAKPMGTSTSRDFRVLGESGLTMLRCSQLIEQFGDFDGRVIISNGAISVDGRSMIDMLQLAAVTGTVLTVELTGRDPAPVMNRIELLLECQH